MKRNALIALLAGGSILIGYNLFTITDVQAQDVKAVRDAEAAAVANRNTDGGVSIEQLEADCMAAREALAVARAAHFKVGTAVTAIDQFIADEAAKCAPMKLKHVDIKVDDKNLATLKATYFCTHKSVGCP